MRRVYEEARRRKEERQAEDRESRRHGDNFTWVLPEEDVFDGYLGIFSSILADFNVYNLTTLTTFTNSAIGGAGEGAGNEAACLMLKC